MARAHADFTLARCYGIEEFFLPGVGRLLEHLLNKSDRIRAKALNKRHIWVFWHAILYGEAVISGALGLR